MAAFRTNSLSTPSTPAPTNSTVTLSTEQGMPSPVGVVNTRQSGRKSIIFFLQFFDFLHKISRLLESAIDAGVTHISDGVQGPQAGHDPFTNRIARHFALVGIGKIVHD